jgi:hypothetical protein
MAHDSYDVAEVVVPVRARVVLIASGHRLC